ncbi:ATP-dependent protease HslVU, ATPase subunit [Neorickettsia helminthoeca str. Oregon]|uniref:ATP-dependent protease HslVU, ATPase subunit n=1 Tax=Neorickettsia helminthoeca str. Oregon TaxID=1286528 RepID=X5H3J3_9RICK|nr:ATP-dependent protease ATPase subunit HslU [Neorickettsia helminthoeca]AHX11126.1 ATP-dependent protease HslVU, ATPase subunit [Neorickettsia helminthoeca str. Oregon]
MSTDKVFKYSAAVEKDVAPLLEDAYSASPKEIVSYLDRFVIGQKLAKKKIAIAIRNRWRRNNVPKPLQDEIIPKNILMIGPTGVGKTEIARRVANLSGAPFIKVEATKFTEVGYVGRDVESIIRDLVDSAVAQVKDQKRREFAKEAESSAKEKILDALVGKKVEDDEEDLEGGDSGSGKANTRAVFEKKLDEGSLDESEIEINIRDIPQNSFPTMDVPGMPGTQIGMMNIGDMMNKVFGAGKKFKKKRVKVKDAWKILIDAEVEELFDEDAIVKDALELVTTKGMVFIDEIDKICARSEVRGEVNREGVQRDLLPLLEGTAVVTKYGVVKTDHILFVGSGAFHFAKPSDLLPELQGRLPIRVELDSLDVGDMTRILTETESSLLKQYCALLETEGVSLEFTKDGVSAIAEAAITVNSEVENIGARRLHTIMETLLEEINFESGENKGKTFSIDREYVDKYLQSIIKKLDLSKFIL